MKQQRRQDRFAIGDRVDFIDEDPYDGFGMADRHRSRHGPGPYEVEDVEDSTDAPWLASHMPHPQLLYVSGHRYSGAWFKPVRKPGDPLPVPDAIPAATHESMMTILGVDLRTYVLDDGRRVIHADDVHQLLEKMGSQPPP